MAELNQKETQKIKFEDEEIKKIQKFRDDFSEITAKLGEVEIELTLIETQLGKINEYKSQLRNKYIQLRESEIKLANELKEKYGEGEFDINTGLFTPNE
jgi:DNA repair exonuclease SbcCD ATPase subunit